MEKLQDVIDIVDVDGTSLPCQWTQHDPVMGSVLAKEAFPVRVRLKSPSSLLVKLGFWKLQDPKWLQKGRAELTDGLQIPEGIRSKARVHQPAGEDGERMGGEDGVDVAQGDTI